ncbi:hypothetical protein [Phocaeicola plebeius]|uniref:hypothetical protein n=1 Tax=Phocaeicola plebeius TaxID=310297 RepID=UPI00241F8FB0|nr:hypothetical protein [Phocaeicola plebeius]
MNKVIEVTENDVKAAFQAAKTDEMKEVLAALFCKREAPTLDNYKTIKSYEDACEALGVSPIQPEKMNVSKHIVALMKLETISKALWGKDFDPKPDPKGEKCFWYPYFALYTQDEIEGLNEAQRGALLSARALYGTTAGFGSLHTGHRSSSATARIGFRLCQETEEKAQYFGTQFIELWAEYLSYNFTTGERIK